MPAGRRGPAARRRNRTALTVLISGLSLSLAAAACTAGGGRGTRAGSAAGHRTPSAPAATQRPSQDGNGHRAAVPPALQITPAAYQLPIALAREAVLPSGHGDVLIAGGIGANSVTTGQVRLLNLRTGQTRRAGRLASPTHDCAGAVLGGRSLVFGGGSVTSVPTVQSLPGRGIASVAGRLPAPRSDLAAVTMAGTAYLLGGYDGTSYDRSVLATADGQHFHAVARLPLPVRYPAAAGTRGSVWVFGGQTPSGPTADIQQIDLATGRARIVGHLRSPVTGAAAFALGGRIFIAGGQTAGPGGTAGAGVTSNAVFAFDPARHTLTRVGRLPVPLAYSAATVVAGTAYLIGGNNGQRQVPAVTLLRLSSQATAATMGVPLGMRATPRDPGGGTPAGLLPAGPPAGTSIMPSGAPWLRPAHGKGHLAPGSDPSVLPGDILIADNWNNRLLIVDPHGRIRWRFPRRGDLRHGQTFRLPDDAFFSPDGRYIIATEEEDSVVSVISIARHAIVYRYGTPGVPGSAANHLANPDDALMLPGGDLLTADIKNCRLLLLAPPARRPAKIFGRTGVCGHKPPSLFASPNGAFPTTTGRYLVTEINGDWASQMSLRGQVSWSTHPPGVSYPSDTNEIYPGRYLTADYSPAGQVVEFNARGKLLWRFRGLHHPSLALPLPNGDILVNDDFDDRVVVIDPTVNRIVWQYGHTGVPGRAPGYLNDPDGMDLVPPNSMLITHAATMGRP